MVKNLINNYLISTIVPLGEARFLEVPSFKATVSRRMGRTMSQKRLLEVTIGIRLNNRANQEQLWWVPGPGSISRIQGTGIK
jgi:hypothetical protein